MAPNRSSLPTRLHVVALVLGLAALGLASARTGREDGASFLVATSDAAQDRDLALPGDGSRGCVACHAGIEPMHPEAKLSCVECHGGDASAKSKSAAETGVPSTRTCFSTRCQARGRTIKVGSRPSGSSSAACEAEST